MSDVEEREIENISSWTKLPIDVIRQQRAINDNDAIERFLSNESKTVLERAGYKRDCQTLTQRLNTAFSLIRYLWDFKSDFYRTEEGRLWYDCNVPNLVKLVTREICEGRKIPVFWKLALELRLGHKF